MQTIERKTSAGGGWRSVDGWHVLHDLALPDGGATVDHVVVTSGGVFVVEVLTAASEASASAPWPTGSAKRHDRARLRRAIEVVAGALDPEPVPPVKVAGIVAVVGSGVVPGTGQRREVEVVALEDLVRLLATKRRRLGADQVQEVAATIDRRLGARRRSVTPPPPGGVIQVALAS